MNVIETRGLTKDYGKGRGVFALDLAVKQGQVLGFLGPNGAGKTTTIRQLMGFIRPDGGTAEIFGLDCFAKAPAVQARVGYLPGEIAFPDDMTGEEYLRFAARLRGKGSREALARAKELCGRFELDGKMRIKRMSKGTKQKLGIVSAFMHSPALYLLDEPTSGLDPLMQGNFLTLVAEEKAAGKTILLSSHIFEEVERTCDTAAILRAGRLVATENMDALRKSRRKVFSLRFGDEKAAVMFANGLTEAVREGARVTVPVTGDVDALVKRAAGYPLRDLSVRPQSLEELFMHYYGGDAQ